MTTLPVLGVPVESKALKGIDSLLSIAQMPAGVPVGTLAIGKAGAINAGLLAASIERFAKSAEYRAFLDLQLALPDSFMSAKAAQIFLNGELEASRKLLAAYGSK